MDIETLKICMPSKYWALPLNASDSQKAKLANILEHNENGNYLMSVKVDGAQYRLCKDANGVVSLLSRNQSKFGGFLNKIENFPKLQNWAAEFMPNNSFLVGEVYVGSLRESEVKNVTAIMGAKPATAKARQEAGITLGYYVFDILAWDGEFFDLLPNSERTKKLELVPQTAPVVAATYIAPPNLYESISKLIETGYEGAVLLKSDEKYRFGNAAAWKTIKIKREISQTVDVVVMGLVAATRETGSTDLNRWPYWENIKTGEKFFNPESAQKQNAEPISKNAFYGWPSGIKIGAYDNCGNLIELGSVSGLSSEIKEQKENLVGLAVEISAMSFDAVSLRFRHPKLIRLRADKEAKECQLSQLI